MIQLDLAGLLDSTAGEILAAIEDVPSGIQVTGVRLDLPADLEFVPGKACGGPRVLGRLRVRPPSTWPSRRSRRLGRLRLVMTPREEAAREQ